MAITATELHRLYLAYFGRPADFDGFMYYTNDPNITLKSAAAAFSQSPESKALYGDDFGADQINRIYLTLFNREAEPAGLAYWLGEVASGRLPPAEAAYGILVGAQGADALAVANKMQVALAFYGELDTVLELIGYGGDDAAASARAFLARVEGTQGSLDDALADVEDEVAKAIGVEGPGPGPDPDPDPELPAVLDPENPGQGDEPAVPVDSGPAFDEANELFAAGADDLGGSNEADVFFGRIGGASATVQAGDKAHGQGDEDTLNLLIDELAEDSVPDFETEDIEVITVRNRSGELQVIDASNFKNALLFASDNSSNTLFFDNLAQGQAGGTLRDGMSTGAGLYFRYAEAATEAELRLSQAVNDSIAIGGAGIQTTRIRSLPVEEGNSLAQLLVFGDAGEQIEIDALGDLEIAKLKAEAAGTRLVLEGDADSVVLGSLEGVGQVDAGDFAGILEVHSGDDAVFVDGFEFTGGSGSDTYHTRGVLTSGLIDGGEGVDVLAVHASQHLTEATAGFYVGFETLQVHDGVTVEAGLIEGAAITVVDGDAEAGTRIVGLGRRADITVLAANGDIGQLSFEGDDLRELHVNLLTQETASALRLGRISLNDIEEVRIQSAGDYMVELAGGLRLGLVETHGSGSVSVVLADTELFGASMFGAEFRFEDQIGNVTFDARGAREELFTAFGTSHGENVFYDSADAGDVFHGGNLNDTLFYTAAMCTADLGVGGDVLDFSQATDFSTESGVEIQILASLDSRIRNGAAELFDAVSAFDPDGTDSIVGLTAGCSFFLTTGVDATGSVHQVSEVRFGATTISRYGFALFDDSASEENTAYVFQDRNGSETIDVDDIMVRLVGDHVFDVSEFLLVDGDLHFTSL